MNPKVPWARKGKKENPELEISGILGTLWLDRPQGFELYQLPWNLDAANNTSQSHVFSFSCSFSHFKGF